MASTQKIAEFMEKLANIDAVKANAAIAALQAYNDGADDKAAIAAANNVLTANGRTPIDEARALEVFAGISERYNKPA